MSSLPHLPTPSPASPATVPLRPAVDASTDADITYPRPTPPKRWSSRVLFGLEREIEIEHAGQVYRLRQTSLGKLILTK